MLLGDAAHAMPPQGESAGYALEDSILFARVLQHKLDKGLDEVFSTYQNARRRRIDKAYDEAVFGWETQKDSGWLTFLVTSWLTSTFLWWTIKGETSALHGRHGHRGTRIAAAT
jgi:2-polyprenyl-6-methoxyphenol hydroxylase-like FAD-dependent oxidoreductase